MLARYLADMEHVMLARYLADMEHVMLARYLADMEHVISPTSAFRWAQNIGCATLGNI